MINVRDILEVPFFAAIIFYFSMMQKRNLFENILLYFAICVLSFDLYFVLQISKNIKENKNKFDENLITETDYNNYNEFENFEDTIEYFIPSDEFKGRIENYVFTTREEGTGYYFDQ